MTDDTMPVSLQWEVWAQRDGEVMFREAGFTMRCDAESWARMIIDEQGYEFSTFYAQVRGPDGFRKFFRMAQEADGFTLISGMLDTDAGKAVSR